jgi:hypothetical protein
MSYIDECFFYIGTCWRLVVRLTALPLYPGGKILLSHWVGGWVGPRARLDDMEK